MRHVPLNSEAAQLASLIKTLVEDQALAIDAVGGTTATGYLHRSQLRVSWNVHSAAHAKEFFIRKLLHGIVTDVPFLDTDLMQPPAGEEAEPKSTQKMPAPHLPIMKACISEEKVIEQLEQNIAQLWMECSAALVCPKDVREKTTAMAVILMIPDLQKRLQRQLGLQIALPSVTEEMMVNILTAQRAHRAQLAANLYNPDVPEDVLRAITNDVVAPGLSEDVWPNIETRAAFMRGWNQYGPINYDGKAPNAVDNLRRIEEKMALSH
jgi:hypothetical protein